MYKALHLRDNIDCMCQEKKGEDNIIEYYLHASTQGRVVH